MRFPRLPVITTHIIGWILFQSVPLIFLLSMMGSSPEKVFSSFEYWQFVLYYVGVFYLHQHLLLQKWYHGGRKWLYMLSLAAIFASALYLRPFDRMTSHHHEMRIENMKGPFMRQMPRPEGFRPPPPGERFGGRRMRIDIIGIFLLAMVIMFGIAMDIARRSRLAEQRAVRAEADRANAELSFLKAQINPHFLFNTLNNIYSMAVMKHEHTADMLMKLSNIMRYVTDDVNADFVPLQDEVDCITDYIDLQQMRLGSKTTLRYTVDGNTEGRYIAPLLLVTFVENLFKYGISKQEHSELQIRLEITPDKICFYTRNRIYPLQQQRDDRTGIGIDNTRKRLQHLYPGQHTLEVTQEEGLFRVKLCLNA